MGVAADSLEAIDIVGCEERNGSQWLDISNESGITSQAVNATPYRIIRNSKSRRAYRSEGLSNLMPA